ncbi:hypothetical protein RJ639_031974 [Escallonia herrerae]|uniref:Uncharacterized protein n=1 Tax=Escallonia herrerae TaxID=1293975 RepID=A0AA88X8I3_9ASTE|nr:hypothetical protein RJ639_031974 [Escallonia herrerae]
MALDMDDGEFWLPPQFLADDDDVLSGYRNNKPVKTGRSNAGVGLFGGEIGGGFSEFPSGFGPSGPNSDLSSAVESVLGSTETESDEEDFLAGLTRKMARSTLQDDLWKVDSGFGYQNTKSWGMATSPQSTLCNDMGGGCGCKIGSSRGSPNCLSQVSSPPPSTAALNRNDSAWGLLYAAAGEVARMRMIEEGARSYYQNRGRVAAPPACKPSPISVPLKNPNPNSNLAFHSNQPLSYHQLQAAHFQQLKQQQLMKQQRQFQQNQAQHMAQSKARSNNARPLALPQSAWPTLQQSQQQQQQPGSGMRAVFLGNPATKRECAGTGVFLPRRTGAPTETRKKPGCSTVLLPDRVVQALNLNLESMDAPPPQIQPRYSDYDAALKYRNSVVLMSQQQQRGINRPQPVMNNEVRLPQEWTY